MVNSRESGSTVRGWNIVSGDVISGSLNMPSSCGLRVIKSGFFKSVSMFSLFIRNECYLRLDLKVKLI